MRAVEDIVHYVICLDFKFRQLFIIWVSDTETDRVLVDEHCEIVAFESEIKFREFAKADIDILSNEFTQYDIYKLQQWLLDPHPAFDGVLFLNLWNLFIDVSESINVEFLGDIHEPVRDSVYNKLFDMSGLFIVDDPTPVFASDEIDVLSRIMQNGLDILLSGITIKE